MARPENAAGGQEQIYSVSRLTREIRAALEGTFGRVLVEGEVSNFKVYPSGHAYFSLKDQDSLLSCVMFKSSLKKAGAEFEDGMKVLCRGHVSVYDRRGQYQLYVSSVDPVGEGALQAAFEKLKKKLFDEGLFDERTKKPLPALPLRIGVVTSPAGAAIRDVLQVAKRRYPDMHITLLPVKVQGEGAAEEIAEAIRTFNEYNLYLADKAPQEHKIDVLIVGRGGGSLEDLWAFNEEAVARAVYASEIPVVSAVGHEIDYTISDFAADMRAPTPSAAAELCVPLKSELSRGVKAYRKELDEAIDRYIREARARLEALKGAYVLKEPVNVITQLEQQIDDLLAGAGTGLRHGLELRGKELALAAGKLGALSPLAVLERGYSITFARGKALRSVSGLKQGDRFETRLSKGVITGTVEKISSISDTEEI